MDCEHFFVEPELTPAPKMEVAHVLFMDVVEYSRLPMDQQLAVGRRLMEMVQSQPEYKRARTSGDVISLWTGDGMALAFFGELTDPVLCAREIVLGLKPGDGFTLRIGIHTGPVYRVADINANLNVAGGGINVAQRVMDCGDGGHILISKAAAEMLTQLSRWKPALHDLGEVVVKHGERLHLFNLYEDDFGNRARPSQLPHGRASSKPGEYGCSIAVLPFANMSGDKENEYFGDGLAEEIIIALANVSGMKVAARTSSFFFRGRETECREIGRRLNVEHILEGSVRKAGNRIRVTAQLIKVADGFHLWSERYDREMTDIFAIQDEITQAIAANLRVKLSANAETPRYIPNLRAYEAYLTARSHWMRPTPDSLARVKQGLERAIEFDPKFALAHSLLGGHYTMLANIGLRPAREVIPLARAAEQEALRIEPALPEAHALLGVCAGTDYEWDEAAREWRLAMAREPVSRDVLFWYGNHYLLTIGRVADAVEAMAAGVQEDPLNVLYRHHYAAGLRNAGKLDEAEVELRKILEIDENFPLAVGTLGAVCAQQGRHDEALALTERAYELTPWSFPIAGQLAALLLRAGARSRADALIGKLKSNGGFGVPTALAIFHAQCGELDRAVEWAARAIEERYPRMVALVGPLLRGSPQWPALEKLMNMPA